MSWHANQVYALPAPDVIAAFRTQPFLADQLYHVNDLRGVRSEWTRERLSHRPPRGHTGVWHTLPHAGLLVVSPEIYQTGYDRDDPVVGEFARHFRHNTPWPKSPPAAKWSDIQAPHASDPFFPAGLDREFFPVGLMGFLEWVRDRTGSPLVYYHCSMWGGSVDRETAWIIGAEPRVYEFDGEGIFIEHTMGGNRRLHGNLLSHAMRHVGVDLATGFFALHETSFHWRLYRLPSTV